jgi:hypothetical protein
VSWDRGLCKVLGARRGAETSGVDDGDQRAELS